MTNLDALLNQYENGSLSRRDLLAALALLVAAPAAADAAQAAKPVGAVKSMNHVSVFVPNVQKSVDFYQGLFGMPILTRQDAPASTSRPDPASSASTPPRPAPRPDRSTTSASAWKTSTPTPC